MVFFPRARSRSRMRCWAARSSLTGTTSWFEATAAELPFVLRCCHRRTTEGETASSRANSESVSYWRTTRAICSCLNCVVKKRRPSDPRRCVSIRRPSVEKSNYPSQTASSNWGTEQQFYGLRSRMASLSKIPSCRKETEEVRYGPIANSIKPDILTRVAMCEAYGRASCVTIERWAGPNVYETTPRDLPNSSCRRRRL